MPEKKKLGRHRMSLLARRGALGDRDIAPLSTPRAVLATLRYLMNRYETQTARELLRRVRYTCIASERGWSLPAYTRIVDELCKEWGPQSRKAISLLAYLDPSYTKSHIVTERGEAVSAGFEQEIMTRFWRRGECRCVSMAATSLLEGDDPDYELYEAATGYMHNQTGRRFTSGGVARCEAVVKAPTDAGKIADMVRGEMAAPRVDLQREITRWLCGAGMYTFGDPHNIDDVCDGLLATNLRGLRRYGRYMAKRFGEADAVGGVLARLCAQSAMEFAVSQGADTSVTLRDALDICLRCEPSVYEPQIDRYCAYSGRHPLPDLAILALLDPDTFRPLILRRRAISNDHARQVYIDVDSLALLETDTDNIYRDVWLSLRTAWVDEGEAYDPVDDGVDLEGTGQFERWEPYEYYTVDGLVLSALRRQGEEVIDVAGLGDVWLRGCTGQSVVLDGWASDEFKRMTTPNEYGEYDPLLDRLIP